MRSLPLAVLSVALATAPISTASAQEEYHHHRYGVVGGVFGLAGAVVVGAVTIVTLPIRVLADAVSGPHRDRRGEYDQRYGGYYGSTPAYGREDSDAYAGPRGEYADGSRYGYPPRGYFRAPPPNYEPNYDRDRSEDSEAEGYGRGERGYARPPVDAYARQEYNAPRGYYRDRPGYGPPQTYEPRDEELSGPRDGADDEQRSYRDRYHDDDE